MVNCFLCDKPIQNNDASCGLLVKRDLGGYFPEWFHELCSDEYKKQVRKVSK